MIASFNALFQTKKFKDFTISPIRGSLATLLVTILTNQSIKSNNNSRNDLNLIHCSNMSSDH